MLMRGTLSQRLRTVAGRRLASSASSEPYDCIVVGGGPGGYVAAIKAAQLGLKTACVEKRGKLGGTCLNVGCIPSKALLHASHLYEEAGHKFADYGIKIKGLSLDLPGMMKSKDKAVTGLTSGIEGLFKKNKVTYVKGHGRLVDGGTVEVTGMDGSSTERLSAKNIILATGSEPSSLPNIEIDEQLIVSSTGALSLPKVPKRMVVIGGGVIGLELGSVWQRLGAEVTVVEYAPHICGGADRQVATEFRKLLTKQGMTIHTEAAVTDVVRKSKSVAEVHYKKDGKDEVIECDVVLMSVGRRPYTHDLGLDTVGLTTDKMGRIDIDDEFRTGVPTVRAIGDVVRGPMLAHKAEDEGIAVAEMLATGHGHINYDAIPSVIYTAPEVAWVGKTEEELKDNGVKFKKGVFPFMANSRARTNDDAAGMVKVLSDAETDRLLGCHIVNTHAGELIAEMVLAMEYGASAEDVARTVHAHPTLSEGLKEASMLAWSGKAIHF